MNKEQLLGTLLEQSSFLAFPPADLAKIEQRLRSKRRVYVRLGFQWKDKKGNSRREFTRSLRTSLEALFAQVASRIPNCQYKLDFAALRGEAGTYLLRNIMLDVISADILLFDITYQNPNVFFELGIAYATDRRVFVLVKEAKRQYVPSDLNGLTISTYREEAAFSLDPSTRSDFKKLVREIIRKKMKLQVERSR